MKTKIILALVLPQLVLIFGQIYKSSVYLRYSYAKQRNVKLVDELTEKNNELTRTLEQIKSNKSIKEYAVKNGLEPLKLKQLKKISDYVKTSDFAKASAVAKAMADTSSDKSSDKSELHEQQSVPGPTN